MSIELKMPALSPTMEEGTLAKWLVKEGDEVKSGDILAEIETDKATMEFEAVDEGKIAKILVAEGTDGVKVGAPIAILAGEGEDASAAASAAPKQPSPSEGEGAEAKPKAGEGAPKPDEPTAGGTPSSPPSPPRGEGAKAPQLQDLFLAAAARERERMTLFLVNGVMLQGSVTGFDQFSLLLERGGHVQLVYKHAISTLQPAHSLNLGAEQDGKDDEGEES